MEPDHNKCVKLHREIQKDFFWAIGFAIVQSMIAAASPWIASTQWLGLGLAGLWLFLAIGNFKRAEKLWPLYKRIYRHLRIHDLKDAIEKELKELEQLKAGGKKKVV